MLKINVSVIVFCGSYPLSSCNWLCSDQADILQLDVVWLFDSFEGNDSDNVDLTEDRNVRESSYDGRIYTRDSWNALKAKHMAIVTKTKSS
jgi:hypothetical protein